MRHSEIQIIASEVVEETVRAVFFPIKEGDAQGLDKEVRATEARVIEILRDELEKSGVRIQQKRKAIVEAAVTPSHLSSLLRTVREYLPANFAANLLNPAEVASLVGAVPGDQAILIEGYDQCGWTLDEYVIPRLASGLIVAKEVK